MAEWVKKFQRERDLERARFRVLFLLSLLAIAVVSCVANPVPNSEIPLDPIELKVFSLDELYARALAMASEWRSDAQLVDATLTYRRASDSRGRWAVLGFRSPSSPLAWLNVVVTEDSEGLEHQLSPGTFETTRPLGDPITPDLLLVKSQEALEIGSSNGGSEFIRDRGNSMRWPQSLYLHYADDVNQTGPIVWRVSYFIPRDPPLLSVKINAETGELLESTLSE
jgi:hypothetical protein